MSIITKQIADGINLTYVETDKFKTGMLSANFIAPLDSASAAKNALIPNILMRGCVKYPSMAQINKKLDYLYASSLSARNMKRGERQIFGISAGMINSDYTMNGEDLVIEVTDVLGDILFNPVTCGEAFDTAYTESEKRNLIDAINAKINNKALYARQRCIKEMCKNERFGLDETGTAEEVAACTAETVYAQYKAALETYPVEIFFVGKCNIDALADKLTELFSCIARKPIPTPQTEIIRTCDEPKNVTEDMPVNQGKLTIGFRSGITVFDADYPALMMFNEVFGGGVTSKLFMNVREKMSLCYYCASAPDAAKGLLIVASGIEVANREIAQKAIFDQLDAIKRGEISDDEIRGARLGLINNYKELADSASGLESWYLGRRLAGLDGAPEDMIEAIAAVSRDDIAAAANKATLDTVYFLNGTLKGAQTNA